MKGTGAFIPNNPLTENLKEIRGSFKVGFLTGIHKSKDKPPLRADPEEKEQTDDKDYVRHDFAVVAFETDIDVRFSPKYFCT